MDPILLKFYERELQFIKEMGAEFARDYPKIAGRLGIDENVTSDPYVERLYEGFAFLAARVHLRIDAEYPKFTQNLLNIIYPQYLSPTPSMAIVQFEPGEVSGFEAGVQVPRHSTLRAESAVGDQTACLYQTAQPVTLWPVAIKQAEYFTNIGAVSDLDIPRDLKPKAGLRIMISTTGGQPVNEILMDSLRIYLTGRSGKEQRIYEKIFGRNCGIYLRSRDSHVEFSTKLPADSLRPIGFTDDEALFPEDRRTFSGFRLLREYFSFPQRYLFFEIGNLGSAVERCQGQEMELVLLFADAEPELEKLIDKDDFALFCTPVINLFPKRADRIRLAVTDVEQHLVVDRTRPQDFEVFQINSVKGYGSSEEDQQDFEPLYQHTDSAGLSRQKAFYSLRRERRVLSSSQQRKGTRSSYVGSEVYLSLVDAKEAPISTNLQQLEVQTLCTNRDLPMRMPVGKSDSDFELDGNAPVARIKVLAGPTQPKPSLSHSTGETPWRLINQLSLNFLSLVNYDELTGAERLRELLYLYADRHDPATIKQIEGVSSVRAEQVIRRIPSGNMITFGKGLKIIIVCEESAFVGAGMFLLGAVLEQFMSRYVSINSFTEVVVRSSERGEVMQWPARIGQKIIV